jgi:hypothetical protein
MTKQNKLIVGGVVLVALLFLYDRNKKMKEMAMMKAKADELAQNQRETKAITKAGFNRAKEDNTAIGGLPTMVDLG